MADSTDEKTMDENSAVGQLEIVFITCVIRYMYHI